jgi:hypothetical protein
LSHYGPDHWGVRPLSKWFKRTGPRSRSRARWFR